MRICCDGCRSEYNVTADQEGLTHVCPRCGGAVYVRQGASTSRGVNGAAGFLPRVKAGGGDRELLAGADEMSLGVGGIDGGGARLLKIWPIVGWVAFGLAFLLRLSDTPTTWLLSLACTGLAVAGGIGLVVSRRRLHGVVLVVCAVLVPAGMSVLYWRAMNRQVEEAAREVERGFEAVSREISAATRSLVDSPPLRSGKPTVPSPARNWEAARTRVRIGGIGQSGGRAYVLINGQVTYEGAEVTQTYGPHLYRWTVRVRDDRVDLVPLTASPL